MKILKILFLLPLSILSLKMTAQVDDLLKNKDITWIAETYNDFLTEAAHADKIGKEISRATLLKFVNTKEAATDGIAIFQNLFMNNVKEGKIPIYKDSLCKIAILPKDLMWTDTLLTVDPVTYEQKIKVVSYYNPQLESILFFRARQVVFYNSKKAQYGLRTLAVAPMVAATDIEGNFTHWKPTFWIKVTDLTKKKKLNDNDITWASRMTLSGGIKIRLDDTIKIVKTIGETLPMTHLFEAVEKNPKVPIYRIEDPNPKEKFTMNERFNLLTRTDTIMTIDPITYETKVRVVFNKFSVEEVKRLQLVQNWYWNDKKKRLEIYLLATAPLRDVTTDEGLFLYKLPLFYRRTDD
jgi:hypothetical protein